MPEAFCFVLLLKKELKQRHHPCCVTHGSKKGQALGTYELVCTYRLVCTQALGTYIQLVCWITYQGQKV